MKSVAGKVLFAAFSVLYPALVFCGLEFWGLSPRRLSLMLIGLAFVHFFNVTKGRSKGSDGSQDRANIVKNFALVALMFVCGAIAFFADRILFLKFYPVLVSLSLLAFFSFTL